MVGTGASAPSRSGSLSSVAHGVLAGGCRGIRSARAGASPPGPGTLGRFRRAPARPRRRVSVGCGSTSNTARRSWHRRGDARDLAAAKGRRSRDDDVVHRGRRASLDGAARFRKSGGCRHGIDGSRPRPGERARTLCPEPGTAGREARRGRSPRCRGLRRSRVPTSRRAVCSISGCSSCWLESTKPRPRSPMPRPSSMDSRPNSPSRVHASACSRRSSSGRRAIRRAANRSMRVSTLSRSCDRRAEAADQLDRVGRSRARYGGRSRGPRARAGAAGIRLMLSERLRAAGRPERGRGDTSRGYERLMVPSPGSRCTTSMSRSSTTRARATRWSMLSRTAIPRPRSESPMPTISS